MYPLIGTEKKFYYKTGGTTNDVTLSANAIKWNSLFPAIKLKDVIDAIQVRYGITFTGTFLNLIQWKKLRLYCKNAETLSVPTEQLGINFTTTSGAAFPEMNLTTDVLTTNNSNVWPNVGSTQYTGRNMRVAFKVTPIGATSLTTKYNIYVYKNGILFYKVSDVIGIQETAFGITPSATNNNTTYSYKVDSENPFSFTPSLIYTRQAQKILLSYPWLETFTNNSSATGATQTTVGNIQIKNYLPDISMVDFFSGLVKMFNLMIVPQSTTVFELIPLESYYNAGNINDITKYVRSEEADIERPKLFKSISFQYEKSNNILNNAFYRTNNLEYGDLVLNNINTNESSNYEIKLPFENIMFERATLADVVFNFETATLIDKDLKPYTPKPIFIYENGETLVNGTGNTIWITTTTGTNSQMPSYVRFSNEIMAVPTDPNYLMSLNFGEYQSPWYYQNASNGLYARHYENYIANIYNNKTRIIKVKAVFPDKLLGSTTTNGTGKKLGLKLNDRLIIRDKRYIINSFTTDLTTGETDLELINDYRGADAASTVGYKLSSSDQIRVDNTEKEIEYAIYKNEYDSFNILPQDSAGFVKYVSVSDCIEDTMLQVIIDNNITGVERVGRINLEYFKNGTSVLTTFLIVQQDA